PGLEYPTHAAFAQEVENCVRAKYEIGGAALANLAHLVAAEPAAPQQIRCQVDAIIDRRSPFKFAQLLRRQQRVPAEKLVRYGDRGRGHWSGWRRCCIQGSS